MQITKNTPLKSNEMRGVITIDFVGAGGGDERDRPVLKKFSNFQRLYDSNIQNVQIHIKAYYKTETKHNIILIAA